MGKIGENMFVVSMLDPNGMPVGMGIFYDMETAVLSLKKTGTVIFTHESQCYCAGLVTVNGFPSFLATEFTIVKVIPTKEVHSLFRE